MRNGLTMPAVIWMCLVDVPAHETLYQPLTGKAACTRLLCPVAQPNQQGVCGCSVQVSISSFAKGALAGRVRVISSEGCLGSGEEFTDRDFAGAVSLQQLSCFWRVAADSHPLPSWSSSMLSASLARRDFDPFDAGRASELDGLEHWPAPVGVCIVIDCNLAVWIRGEARWGLLSWPRPTCILTLFWRAQLGGRRMDYENPRHDRPGNELIPRRACAAKHAR